PLTARPPFPTGASVVVGAPFPLAGRAGGWVGGVHTISVSSWVLQARARRKDSKPPDLHRLALHLARIQPPQRLVGNAALHGHVGGELVDVDLADLHELETQVLGQRTQHVAGADLFL